MTDLGQVVLVSSDGITWDLPGGRPEGSESWEQTLEREVWEEACAGVKRASLLGFGRSEMLEGPLLGEVLVRSFWRAEVALEPWEPRFEMKSRRVLPTREAIACLAVEYGLVYQRAFQAAGMLNTPT